MDLEETIKVALEALKANKIRSGLTMLEHSKKRSYPLLWIDSIRKEIPFF